MRLIEPQEQQLTAEVEFWKNELSKVCNEKSYFVARALAVGCWGQEVYQNV